VLLIKQGGRWLSYGLIIKYLFSEIEIFIKEVCGPRVKMKLMGTAN
jgi:hypothetical protein